MKSVPTKKVFIRNQQQEGKLFFHRLLFMSVIVLLMTASLIARMAYLQVEQHERYATLSKQNQLNFLPIRPNRGLIYDRNGLLIAENTPAYSIEVIPDRVKNMDDTLTRLSKLMHFSEDELTTFRRQLRLRHRFDNIPLKMRLTDEEVAIFSVNQYYFPGVYLTADMIRHYPMGKTFAHVLGYVGRINEQELKTLDPTQYSSTNYIGKLGIEDYYEKLLHGKVGYETIETNAGGRIVRTLDRTPPQNGENIYLSLDTQMQLVAERALGELKGAVVALDPTNGEILAFYSNPSFDPNVFVSGISNKDYQALRNDPNQPLYNRVLRGQYPLASTAKPFLALGGLDRGVVSPSFKVLDTGVFTLPGVKHVYKDWKKGGHGGYVNAFRAITVSCDIYFFTLAKAMGIRTLSSILTGFGFGEKTHLDMNDELSGNVPTPEWKRAYHGAPWYEGDTIVAGIGQGYILTTPLQLANAAGTLSRKGFHVTPHLLLASQEIGEDKVPVKISVEQQVKLNDEKNWELVHSAMRNVITSGEGTGYRFGRDAPYEVAAKTGTAQVYSAKMYTHLNEDNLPERLRDHSLFIAFAPVSDPKIAVAVVVENSHAASFVARQVLNYYFGVAPKVAPAAAPDNASAPVN